MIQRYAFVLLSFPFFSTAAHAQPALSSGDISYVPDESFPEVICSWVPPGPSGANQTWDFSALNCSGTFTSNWEATSPWMATGYPTATVAFESQSFSGVYEASAAAFRYLGFAEGISLTSARLSDPADEVRYPFALGSSYTDTFSGDSYFPNGNGGVDSAEVSGTLFVEADAYGTLILPWGTVSDVIRIHKMRTNIYVDGTATEEEYRFYQPGVHHPWMRTNRKTNSWNTDVVEGARYYNPANVGIVGRSDQEASLTVSPNPASGTVTIELPNSGAMDHQLIDATGRMVQVLNSRGEQQITLDLHALPSGQYILRSSSADGMHHTPVIIMH